MATQPTTALCYLEIDSALKKNKKRKQREAACQACRLIMTCDTLEPMDHINSRGCQRRWPVLLYRLGHCIRSGGKNGCSEAPLAAGEVADRFSKHQLRRLSNNGAQVRAQMDIRVTAWPVQTHAVTRTCVQVHCGGGLWRCGLLRLSNAADMSIQINTRGHLCAFPIWPVNPERISHIHPFDH